MKNYTHLGLRYFNKATFLIWCICLFAGTVKANLTDSTVAPPKVTSTQQQAIDYIENINELKPSLYWPNIKPALFLKNLKTNIHNIVSIYPGKNTNFCGYGALAYLFLQDDPLGYAMLLLQLYNQGKASFKNVSFTPSSAINKQQGYLNIKAY